ncbi:MAG: response regulator [Acidobacteriota bacterium]
MTEPQVPSQESVLLIDDDEMVAGSLRERLVRDGRQVDVALDLPTSIGLMDERKYRVIVVDPYLTTRVPGDGSLLKIIRELQPDAAMIVLTAYGSPALTVSAEHANVAALLAKPQSVVFLSDFVGDACRNGTPSVSSSSKGQSE